MNDLEDFARWLDLTISNERLTARDLAQQIGVHDSAISRWRTGQGKPSLETTVKLATALRVDPIRLAVTAGLVDEEDVSVSALPTPPACARRERIREQIRAIKGLTPAETTRLLETYDAYATNDD